MKELQLKYGCNPNQKPSRIYMEEGQDLPIKVLSGKPGYINFLDALTAGSWFVILRKQQDFLQQLLSNMFLLQELQ